MKTISARVLTLLFINSIGVALAQKEGKKKHEVLSWEAPLTNNDFENWKFTESSIALKDRVVLAPTAKDQYGFMQCMWVSITFVNNLLSLF